MTGNRRGTLIYICENFTYRKNKEVGNKLYVRCGTICCPGTGYIVNEKFTLLHRHIHGPDLEEVNTLRLRQDLRKSVVENRGTSIRSIFNTTCQRHPDAAALTTFRSSKDFMYRERITKHPPEPRCPQKPPLKRNRKRIMKQLPKLCCLQKPSLKNAEASTQVVEAPVQDVEAPVQDVEVPVQDVEAPVQDVEDPVQVVFTAPELQTFAPELRTLDHDYTF